MNIFSYLLALYPAAYRAQFGEEMEDVVRQATEEARLRRPLGFVAAFCRESWGLLAGAAGEHLRSSFGEYRWYQVASRRFNMRKEFHYPKATVPMMALIFACIVLIIYKAGRVQLSTDLAPYQFNPPHYTFLVTFGLAFLVACLAGLVGWLVLHSLRQSGVHRLSEAQTWPQAK